VTIEIAADIRFRLEFFPTNPKRPSAIWDHHTPDEEGWWRLVANFHGAGATMREAEIMCAALNREAT
jgi:hypothetical protein